MVGILSLFLLLLASVQCERTGVSDLEKMLKLERELLHNFRNYAKELQEKLQLINGAIAEYSENIREVGENPDLYMANPLYAFRLMSHMRRDWPAWQLYMRQEPGTDQIELQQRLLTLLPKTEVHRAAAQSLESLIDFYDYAPSKFSEGYEKHLSLSPLDCYQMGVELYKQEKYHKAAMWLDVAAGNYTRSPHQKLLGEPHWRVYEMQVMVFMKLNMRDEALGALARVLEMQPENERLLHLRYQLQRSNTQPLPAPGKLVSGLQQQCRGESKLDSHFMCHLNTIVSPFLRLAPLHLTHILYEPYIMLYRDGIYEHETRHIRKAFRRCPAHSRIETLAGAKGCPISENYSAITLTLTQRIADMTGVNLHMERMFVFEYGPRDPFQLSDLLKEFVDIKAADIEATVIVFLNDVPLGGAISMTNHEVAVLPRRGEALIVFNDDDVQITVCPNVVGNRLVLVKVLLSQ